MARKIEDIKSAMVETMKTLPALAKANSNSQVAIVGNILHTTAVQTGILEQLIDHYIGTIPSIINAQAIGSIPWLRAKVLEFQYGDHVELNTTTFEIAYPAVDVSKKIITRCSVKEGGNLNVQVKVAKSDPPEQLTNDEILKLESYLDIIKPAGIQTQVISEVSDKLYIECIIYCKDISREIVKANVINAITAFMATFSNSENYDGTLRVVDLIDAIQSVQGVVDLNIAEIGARTDTTTFANRMIIYKLLEGVNNREYETISGYLAQETESGYTFVDKITVAES